MHVDTAPRRAPDLLGGLTVARERVRDLERPDTGLGLTVEEVDELLYAADVRADALGTNIADRDARARLDRARTALERELCRLLAA